MHSWKHARTHARQHGRRQAREHDQEIMGVQEFVIQVFLAQQSFFFVCFLSGVSFFIGHDIITSTDYHFTPLHIY